ncbi:CRISPR system Cascade subunit CasA [Stackebrandtia albiflava]|uniref:CRISPR system Cascade subunit CasA n=1 Tax=Stackebrandtia albiflava TaxID=406432 RepID=A0A562UR94_9ACTN|nr:type I-E CRISPR-associated protein Cse1/CasA [Stackebrandtia albiflava]TWJ08140.1 CRISPR system Cascade subunit CasA [Stackebrandtia albiflava]
MDIEVRFSLLDSAWIQVLTTDGAVEELSLRELFARADEVVELLGESPTQSFAIMRLLLAIVHRAVDGPSPRGWGDLFEAGALPVASIKEYLDRHADRFWLFHPSTPFYQVVGLRSAKDEVSGLEKLISDVPTGGPLFIGRSGTALERISFAEATRWLVQLQGYDVSGIKTGAVGDPRVKGGKGYPIGTGHAGALGGVYVRGGNLTETLLLNLVSDRDVGTAVWERPPHTSAPEGTAAVERRPTGVADLYTWQSRRIRLVCDGEAVTGVVVANGDRLPAHETFPLEPMTMWRRSRIQEKKLGLPLVYFPRLHDPEKSLWRSAESLLPAPPAGTANAEPDFRPPGVVEHLETQADADAFGQQTSTVTLRAVGMQYGTQNAVTNEVVTDDLEFQAALLRETHPELRRLVRDAVEAAVEACKAVGLFAADLVRAAGGDSFAQVAQRDRAREAGYHAIDGEFREWLSGLGEHTDVEDAAIDWQQRAGRALRRLKHGLIAATPPSAYRGRTEDDRQINVATAERWLNHRLRKALPKAHASDETREVAA